MSVEKKVFISYSHSSEEYKEKIRNFASSLQSNGVFVYLDEWDVSGGNDFNAFMEMKIKDADKVIIACDRVYMEKANNRQGGAGTEAYIISPEVYSNYSQTKYIPVIFEKDINGNAYLPEYLKGRKYYDLSNDQIFMNQYEYLIRDIFDKPKYTRPPLGTLPKYILDFDLEDPKSIFNHFYSIERNLDYQLMTNKKNSYIRDFKDEIISYYEKSLIKYEDYKQNSMDVIYNKIIESEDLLNIYIKALEVDISNNNLDLNSIISMFEFLAGYDSKLVEGTNTSTDGMWDHLNFLTNELFIYTIIVLRNNNCRDEVKRILKTNYLIYDKFNGQKFYDFTIFNKYSTNLDNRNTYYKLNKLSLQADLMYERALKTKYGGKVFTETDIYLSYYSELINNAVWEKWWWPRTYIYYDDFGKSFSNIFSKYKSKRFFKGLLEETGLSNKEEFIKSLEHLNAENKKSRSIRGYQRSFSHIPFLSEIIDIDSLDSID